MTVSARSGDAVNANGNQVTRTVGGVSYTFVYDYNNRLTEVKQGETVLAAFVYDADGERVLGSVGGVTTVYVGGVYEYVVGTGATTHYYEGNALRRTGHAGDNGVFYLLQDHLHSSSALAAQNGTLSGARNYFYPFGGSRGGAFNALTTKRFTGQYHEATIPGGEGLSYYGARWYDARLGRFITPDSIVPNPANPQDFNRYTYVRNNPLKYLDPSGHQACAAGMCGGGAIQEFLRWLGAAASAGIGGAAATGGAFAAAAPVVAGVLGAAALGAGAAYALETYSTSEMQTFYDTPAIDLPTINFTTPLNNTTPSGVQGIPLAPDTPQALHTPAMDVPAYQESFSVQGMDYSPYLASNSKWRGQNPTHIHERDDGFLEATTDMAGGLQAAQQLWTKLGGIWPKEYNSLSPEPASRIIKEGLYRAYFRPWSDKSKCPVIEIWNYVRGTRERIHFR